ncbi:MAG: prolipoprotein diacylglyceryl transferase [Leptospiraceae bacterium]|nr:prolipoprotein diacylglyceryl transferase [Leptospiraceae bacterium]MDW8307420.1 prolipoprotein diacylglyceryl transferase [Leptospiraceae bacterium]
MWQLGYTPFFQLDVPIYGFFLALAFLLVYVYAKFYVKNLPLPPLFAESALLLSAISGYLGAQLFYELEKPYHAWGASHGLNWYGGFLLAAVVLLLYLRPGPELLWQLSDKLTPSLAFGYAMGRLGCFFSGDGCYGIPCPPFLGEPLCHAFPHGVANWQSLVQRYGNPNLRVFNTPLWEAILSLLAYALAYLGQKLQRAGELFLRYLLLHALFRYYVEFLRLNPRIYGGLSQAQIVSLLLFVLALGLLFLNRDRYRVLGS